MRPRSLTALLTLVAFIVTETVAPLPGFSEIFQVSEVKAARPLPFHLTLPGELGKIEKLIPGRGPYVFHIQDAHGNFEAQKNIQAILHYLKDNYDVDLLLVEGAVTRLEPELLRFFPNQTRLTRAINEDLTRKAMVKGADLFLLETGGVEAYGIEEINSYRKNGGAFRAVIREREKTGGFLAQMDEQISRLAVPHMNPQLRSLLERLDDYESHKIPLEDWFTYLGERAKDYLRANLANPAYQAEWPMLVRLFKLRELEGKIDALAFAGERDEFLKGIDPGKVPGLSLAPPLYDQIKRLLTDPKAVLSLPDPETGLLFEEMVATLPKSFNFPAYPNVKLAIARLILQSEIRPDRLIAELASLTDLISKVLAKTEEEKALLDLFKDYRLLKRLFALELTPDDYQSLRGSNPNVAEAISEIASSPPSEAPRNDLRPSNITSRFLALNRDGRTRAVEFNGLSQIESLFDKSLEFYAGVKSRDRVMLSNIESLLKKTRKKKAAVITGGFHAGPFEKHFSKLGLPYALISPKITTTEGRDAYLSAILQETSTYAQPEMANSFGIRQAVGFDNLRYQLLETSRSVAEAAKTLAVSQAKGPYTSLKRAPSGTTSVAVLKGGLFPRNLLARVSPSGIEIKGIKSMSVRRSVPVSRSESRELEENHRDLAKSKKGEDYSEHAFGHRSGGVSLGALTLMGAIGGTVLHLGGQRVLGWILSGLGLAMDLLIYFALKRERAQKKSQPPDDASRAESRSQDDDLKLELVHLMGFVMFVAGISLIVFRLPWGPLKAKWVVFIGEMIGVAGYAAWRILRRKKDDGQTPSAEARNTLEQARKKLKDEPLLLEILNAIVREESISDLDAGVQVEGGIHPSVTVRLRHPESDNVGVIEFGKKGVATDDLAETFGEDAVAGFVRITIETAGGPPDVLVDVSTESNEDNVQFLFNKLAELTDSISVPSAFENELNELARQHILNNLSKLAARLRSGTRSDARTEKKKIERLLAFERGRKIVMVVAVAAFVVSFLGHWTSQYLIPASRRYFTWGAVGSGAILTAAVLWPNPYARAETRMRSMGRGEKIVFGGVVLSLLIVIGGIWLAYLQRKSPAGKAESYLHKILETYRKTGNLTQLTESVNSYNDPDNLLAAVQKLKDSSLSKRHGQTILRLLESKLLKAGLETPARAEARTLSLFANMDAKWIVLGIAGLIFFIIHLRRRWAYAEAENFFLGHLATYEDKAPWEMKRMVEEAKNYKDQNALRRVIRDQRQKKIYRRVLHNLSNAGYGPPSPPARAESRAITTMTIKEIDRRAAQLIEEHPRLSDWIEIVPGRGDTLILRAQGYRDFQGDNPPSNVALERKVLTVNQIINFSTTGTVQQISPNERSSSLYILVATEKGPEIIELRGRWGGVIEVRTITDWTTIPNDELKALFAPTRAEARQEKKTEIPLPFLIFLSSAWVGIGIAALLRGRPEVGFFGLLGALITIYIGRKYEMKSYWPILFFIGNAVIHVVGWYYYVLTWFPPAARAEARQKQNAADLTAQTSGVIGDTTLIQRWAKLIPNRILREPSAPVNNASGERGSRTQFLVSTPPARADARVIGLLALAAVVVAIVLYVRSEWHERTANALHERGTVDGLEAMTTGDLDRLHLSPKFKGASVDLRETNWHLRRSTSLFLLGALAAFVALVLGVWALIQRVTNHQAWLADLRTELDGILSGLTQAASPADTDSISRAKEIAVHLHNNNNNNRAINLELANSLFDQILNTKDLNRRAQLVDDLNLLFKPPTRAEARKSPPRAESRIAFNRNLLPLSNDNDREQAIGEAKQRDDEQVKHYAATARARFRISKLSAIGLGLALGLALLTAVIIIYFISSIITYDPKILHGSALQNMGKHIKDRLLQSAGRAEARSYEKIEGPTGWVLTVSGVGFLGYGYLGKSEWSNGLGWLALATGLIWLASSYFMPKGPSRDDSPQAEARSQQESRGRDKFYLIGDIVILIAGIALMISYSGPLSTAALLMALSAAASLLNLALGKNVLPLIALEGFLRIAAGILMVFHGGGESVIVWVGYALIGSGVLTVIYAIVSKIDRDQPPRAEARSEVAIVLGGGGGILVGGLTIAGLFLRMASKASYYKDHKGAEELEAAARRSESGNQTGLQGVYETYKKYDNADRSKKVQSRAEMRKRDFSALIIAVVSLTALGIGFLAAIYTGESRPAVLLLDRNIAEALDKLKDLTLKNRGVSGRLELGFDPSSPEYLHKMAEEAISPLKTPEKIVTLREAYSAAIPLQENPPTRLDQVEMKRRAILMKFLDDAVIRRTFGRAEARIPIVTRVTKWVAVLSGTVYVFYYFLNPLIPSTVGKYALITALVSGFISFVTSGAWGRTRRSLGSLTETFAPAEDSPADSKTAPTDLWRVLKRDPIDLTLMTVASIVFGVYIGLTTSFEAGLLAMAAPFVAVFTIIGGKDIFNRLVSWRGSKSPIPSLLTLVSVFGVAFLWGLGYAVHDLIISRRARKKKAESETDTRAEARKIHRAWFVLGTLLLIGGIALDVYANNLLLKRIGRVLEAIGFSGLIFLGTRNATARTEARAKGKQKKAVEEEIEIDPVYAAFFAGAGVVGFGIGFFVGWEWGRDTALILGSMIAMLFMIVSLVGAGAFSSHIRNPGPGSFVGAVFIGIGLIAFTYFFGFPDGERVLLEKITDPELEGNPEKIADALRGYPLGFALEAAIGNFSRDPEKSQQYGEVLKVLSERFGKKSARAESRRIHRVGTVVGLASLLGGIALQVYVDNLWAKLAGVVMEIAGIIGLIVIGVKRHTPRAETRSQDDNRRLELTVLMFTLAFVAAISLIILFKIPWGRPAKAWAIIGELIGVTVFLAWRLLRRDDDGQTPRAEARVAELYKVVTIVVGALLISVGAGEFKKRRGGLGKIIIGALFILLPAFSMLLTLRGEWMLSNAVTTLRDLTNDPKLSPKEVWEGTAQTLERFPPSRIEELDRIYHGEFFPSDKFPDEDSILDYLTKLETRNKPQSIVARLIHARRHNLPLVLPQDLRAESRTWTPANDEATRQVGAATSRAVADYDAEVRISRPSKYIFLITISGLLPLALLSQRPELGYVAAGGGAASIFSLILENIGALAFKSFVAASKPREYTDPQTGRQGSRTYVATLPWNSSPVNDLRRPHRAETRLGREPASFYNLGGRSKPLFILVSSFAGGATANWVYNGSLNPIALGLYIFVAVLFMLQAVSGARKVHYLGYKVNWVETIIANLIILGTASLAGAATGAALGWGFNQLRAEARAGGGDFGYEEKSWLSGRTLFVAGAGLVGLLLVWWGYSEWSAWRENAARLAARRAAAREIFFSWWNKPGVDDIYRRVGWPWEIRNFTDPEMLREVLYEVLEDSDYSNDDAALFALEILNDRRHFEPHPPDFQAIVKWLENSTLHLQADFTRFRERERALRVLFTSFVFDEEMRTAALRITVDDWNQNQQIFAVRRGQDIDFIIAVSENYPLTGEQTKLVLRPIQEMAAYPKELMEQGSPHEKLQKAAEKLLEKFKNGGVPVEKLVPLKKDGPLAGKKLWLRAEARNKEGQNEWFKVLALQILSFSVGFAVVPDAIKLARGEILNRLGPPSFTIGFDLITILTLIVLFLITPKARQNASRMVGLPMFLGFAAIFILEVALPWLFGMRHVPIPRAESRGEHPSLRGGVLRHSEPPKGAKNLKGEILRPLRGLRMTVDGRLAMTESARAEARMARAFIHAFKETSWVRVDLTLADGLQESERFDELIARWLLESKSWPEFLASAEEKIPGTSSPQHLIVRENYLLKTEQEGDNLLKIQIFIHTPGTFTFQFPLATATLKHVEEKLAVLVAPHPQAAPTERPITPEDLFFKDILEASIQAARAMDENVRIEKLRYLGNLGVEAIRRFEDRVARMKDEPQIQSLAFRTKKGPYYEAAVLSDSIVGLIDFLDQIVKSNGSSPAVSLEAAKALRQIALEGIRSASRLNSILNELPAGVISTDMTAHLVMVRLSGVEMMILFTGRSLVTGADIEREGIEGLREELALTLEAILNAWVEAAGVVREQGINKNLHRFFTKSLPGIKLNALYEIYEGKTEPAALVIQRIQTETETGFREALNAFRRTPKPEIVNEFLKLADTDELNLELQPMMSPQEFEFTIGTALAIGEELIEDMLQAGDFEAVDEITRAAVDLHQGVVSFISFAFKNGGDVAEVFGEILTARVHAPEIDRLKELAIPTLEALAPYLRGENPGTAPPDIAPLRKVQVAIFKETVRTLRELKEAVEARAGRAEARGGDRAQKFYEQGFNGEAPYRLVIVKVPGADLKGGRVNLLRRVEIEGQNILYAVTLNEAGEILYSEIDRETDVPLFPPANFKNIEDIKKHAGKLEYFVQALRATEGTLTRTLNQGPEQNKLKVVLDTVQMLKRRLNEIIVLAPPAAPLETPGGQTDEEEPPSPFRTSHNQGTSEMDAPPVADLATWLQGLLVNGKFSGVVETEENILRVASQVSGSYLFSIYELIQKGKGPRESFLAGWFVVVTVWDGTLGGKTLNMNQFVPGGRFVEKFFNRAPGPFSGTEKINFDYKGKAARALAEAIEKFEAGGSKDYKVVVNSLLGRAESRGSGRDQKPSRTRLVTGTIALVLYNTFFATFMILAVLNVGNLIYYLFTGRYSEGLLAGLWLSAGAFSVVYVVIGIVGWLFFWRDKEPPSKKSESRTAAEELRRQMLIGGLHDSKDPLADAEILSNRGIIAEVLPEAVREIKVKHPDWILVVTIKNPVGREVILRAVDEGADILVSDSPFSIEVVQEIREINAGVLIISGVQNEDDVRSAIQSGADGLKIKPFAKSPEGLQRNLLLVRLARSLKPEILIGGAGGVKAENLEEVWRAANQSEETRIDFLASGIDAAERDASALAAARDRLLQTPKPRAEARAEDVLSILQEALDYYDKTLLPAFKAIDANSRYVNKDSREYKERGLYDMLFLIGGDVGAAYYALYGGADLRGASRRLGGSEILLKSLIRNLGQVDERAGHTVGLRPGIKVSEYRAKLETLLKAIRQFLQLLAQAPEPGPANFKKASELLDQVKENHGFRGKLAEDLIQQIEEAKADFAKGDVEEALSRIVYLRGEMGRVKELTTSQRATLQTLWLAALALQGYDVRSEEPQAEVRAGIQNRGLRELASRIRRAKSVRLVSASENTHDDVTRRILTYHLVFQERLETLTVHIRNSEVLRIVSDSGGETLPIRWGLHRIGTAERASASDLNQIRELIEKRLQAVSRAELRGEQQSLPQRGYPDPLKEILWRGLRGGVLRHSEPPKGAKNLKGEILRPLRGLRMTVDGLLAMTENTPFEVRAFDNPAVVRVAREFAEKTFRTHRQEVMTEGDFAKALDQLLGIKPLYAESLLVPPQPTSIYTPDQIVVLRINLRRGFTPWAVEPAVWEALVRDHPESLLNLLLALEQEARAEGVRGTEPLIYTVDRNAKSLLAETEVAVKGAVRRSGLSEKKQGELMLRLRGLIQNQISVKEVPAGEDPAKAIDQLKAGFGFPIPTLTSGAVSTTGYLNFQMDDLENVETLVLWVGMLLGPSHGRPGVTGEELLHEVTAGLLKEGVPDQAFGVVRSVAGATLQIRNSELLASILQSALFARASASSA